VLLARDILIAEFGEQIRYVNTPGVTCVEALPILHSYGITHAEPGHALTGTTPLHAVKAAPEKPAIIYVSEVSHIQHDKAYIFGGGFYPRSGMQSALVGSNVEHLQEPAVKCSQPPADKIDYYGRLDDIPDRVQVGDTAIAAFRTQIFVTRSYVAVVKGLHSGEKNLFRLWDSRGRKVTYGIKEDSLEGIQ
jgi:predicted amino acid racemase